MDEVRLWHANSYSKAILRIIDLDDADHFRQGLLRREITGNMAYQQQRDHSAHTLNNYILGWHFFTNSNEVNKAISNHFDIRGVGKQLVRERFGNLWPFVSLLHDLGYLFEGRINPLDTAIQDKQVNVGAEVAQDYFSHRFWTECRVDSMYDRRRILELSKVEIPDFSNRSVAGISDSLRSIGDLETFRKAIKEERDMNVPAKYKDYLSEDYGLPGDAFDLWERHYEYYGLNKMVERIKSLRRAFNSLIQEGLNGMRMLDHGVCSGLLLLQYSSFYFKVRYGLLAANPRFTPADKLMWERFDAATSKPSSASYLPASYSPLWWWRSVLWGTAATAMHNVLQLQNKLPKALRQDKLSLEDDPLAYLGIMVDIIQEWDRYGVSRETVILGNLPLQGVDVEMALDAGVTRIKYNCKRRADKVSEGLDAVLEEWQKIVVIGRN